MMDEQVEPGDATVTPMVPGVRSAHLPGTGGRIGPDVEHFRVEEIPAYQPSGRGEHLYLWVEKEGLNTPDVERRIAKALGIPPRDVGYAGLKDRHAITRQWFSALSKASGEQLDLGPGIRVLACARHDNKLRTGHLRGNRFVITLVEVSAPENAEPIAELLKTQGLANFFGAQRFGREGRNLREALIALGGDGDSRRRKHFDSKLSASVIQAEHFNRYTAARLRIPEPLLEGEVVRLENSAKCFVVEDVERELPRLERGDIHPTGPMVGPKMVEARGVPYELEQAALRELGLGERELDRLGQDAPGTRRDLKINMADFRLTQLGETELKLEFGLPAGGYATELVREFTRTLPSSPR